MRLVLMADTHGMHDKVVVPGGDVLIHAGDFCNQGTFQDAKKFVQWLSVLPHKHKIIIAGNHDRILETDLQISDLLFGGIAEYLLDSETVINEIKFYGSPYQPEFCNWSFNLPTGGKELKQKWAMIPDDTDVLITHCPPEGVLDKVNIGGTNAGCKHLRDRVKKIKPKLHLFGHIHEGRGVNVHALAPTWCINTTICNFNYEPLFKPIVIDYDQKTGKMEVIDY